MDAPGATSARISGVAERGLLFLPGSARDVCHGVIDDDRANGPVPALTDHDRKRQRQQHPCTSAHDLKSAPALLLLTTAFERKRAAMHVFGRCV